MDLETNAAFTPEQRRDHMKEEFPAIHEYITFADETKQTKVLTHITNPWKFGKVSLMGDAGNS